MTLDLHLFCKEGLNSGMPTFRILRAPHRQILNSLDLTVHKEKYIAPVGPSGCRKSTIAVLLERFYNSLACHCHNGRSGSVPIGYERLPQSSGTRESRAHNPPGYHPRQSDPRIRGIKVFLGRIGGYLQRCNILDFIHSLP